MEVKNLQRLLLLLGLIIAAYLILAYGRPLLLPLATAGVLAMVLLPLLRWLTNRGVHQGLGIAICVLVFLSFFVLVAFMLTVQAGYIIRDWPEIEKQALDRAHNLQGYISDRLDVKPDQQMAALRRGLSQLGNFAGTLVNSLSSTVGNFFIVVIYLVLFLIERRRIRDLILKYAERSNRVDAKEIMDQAISHSGKYVVGLLKVIGILSVLYSIGFSIGGVPYAIFLAVLAALFAIIPFLGNIIGGGIAAALALATSGPAAALTVIVVMIIVQMVDNYILQPLVVGNDIDLSPLATIFSILAFSFLWGPAGAILALPLTATLVTVFRQIPDLAPLADFLSRTRTDTKSTVKRRVKRLMGKKE
jgi:predicted PurR-regulated permease PerM